MRSLKTTQLRSLSALAVSRELAVAADRSLWAGDQNECIAIIARLYSLFDDFEQGLKPDLRGRVIAASTAAWVEDRRRCAELLGDVDA